MFSDGFAKIVRSQLITRREAEVQRNTTCLNVIAVLGTLLMCGCGWGANSSDIASYRMIPLVPDPDGEKHCSQDQKWCVQLAQDADTGGVLVSATRDGKPGRERTLAYDILTDADSFGATDREVWPFLITASDRSADVLVGVISAVNVGYSGGGTEAHFLDVIRLDAGDGPSLSTNPVVLSVPIGAVKMIRACFSDADIQKRRDVCHDEYRFAADIRLSHHGVVGLPAIEYASRATAFPATASLDQDSTQLPGLRDEDLVERVDERCSFDRIFRFDVAHGRYEPDVRLPDCDDYLMP